MTERCLCAYSYIHSVFYAHIPHAYTCAQVYDRGGYHVPALLTHEEEGRADALPLRMAGTWRRTWSTRTGTVCVCEYLCTNIRAVRCRCLVSRVPSLCTTCVIPLHVKTWKYACVRQLASGQNDTER